MPRRRGDLDGVQVEIGAGGPVGGEEREVEAPARAAAAHGAQLGPLGDVDAELLVRLAPRGGRPWLRAARSAARELPGAAVPVGVADEEHAAAGVEEHALDAPEP